jgi:nucleotide-binding universal stress UspA family protein
VKNIRKILILSRATQLCENAINQGFELAEKIGGEIYILHIMHDPFEMNNWDMVMPYDKAMKNEYKKLQDKEKSKLDEIIDSHHSRDLISKEIIVRKEPLKRTIEFIKQEGIDMLIINAQNEEHSGHFFYHCFNEKIIKKLPCSIFLVD